MKGWLCFFIFLMPLSMMLNVHQSKSYLKTSAEIKSLERKQNQLLEENQRIIAEIARNSAPTSIEKLVQARGTDLHKISPSQVLRIIVPEDDVSAQ